MKKAVVILSGGQDSTTCLYWAKKQFDEIACISFAYGQSHSLELMQAQTIARNAGVSDHHIVEIPRGILVGSSLVSGGDHNEPSSLDESLPASFTPGRNLLFAIMAASMFVGDGFTDYVMGVCQTDYSGYPDCRRSTIDALELSLTLGMGSGDIRIHTPLMYLTKAQTWRLANQLGCLDVIINDTITDYDGDMTKNEWGYGKLDNPASKLRAQGYFEAKEKGWV